MSRIEGPAEEAGGENLLEAILSITSSNSEFCDKITYIDGDFLGSNEHMVLCAPRRLNNVRGILAKVLSKFKGVNLLKKQNSKIGECSSQVVNGSRNIFYLMTTDKESSTTNEADLRRSLEKLALLC